MVVRLRSRWSTDRQGVMKRDEIVVPQPTDQETPTSSPGMNRCSLLR
jgi:hypothetical protein